MSDPMLSLTDLAKHYQGPKGPVRALDGVSLTVNAGEFAAVCGPSGCGKSTLLLAAGALLAPTGGRVRIGDQDPYALSSEGRARLRATRIGFVFQQFHLVPYLSVLDNILAPALALGTARSQRPRAQELADQFGLGLRSSHLPSALSTGERQRTALARALLNRPALLLADEPTGNLDPANRSEVLSALAAFARQGGAVLLVTHDAEAEQAADRVIRMESGTLKKP